MEDNENTDRNQSDSSVELENVVEIHGDIEGLGEESLKMYLESRKRSGGGDIQEIYLKSNPPRIVFDDPEGKSYIFHQIF